MTREEAFQAMQDGKKIAHDYFSTYEYYAMNSKNIIVAEDGVDHTTVFWGTNEGNWRANGWYIVD
jgi:hypothetical protein